MVRRRADLAGASALALAALVAVGAVVLGCATDAEARRRATPGHVETGQASYYGAKFTGRRTALGERYDPRKLTAAHKSLPVGTAIRSPRPRLKRPPWRTDQ